MRLQIIFFEFLWVHGRTCHSATAPPPVGWDRTLGGSRKGEVSCVPWGMSHSQARYNSEFAHTTTAIQLSATLAFVFALAVFLFAERRRGIRLGMPGFAILGWLANNSDGIADDESSVSAGSRTRSKKGKHTRKSSKDDSSDNSKDASSSKTLHYPGLPNPTSTLCFANSILQSLSSLPLFNSYLHSLQSIAESYDVPTPLLDSLLSLMAALNTPSRSRGKVLRREVGVVIEALMDQGGAPPNRWREREDAMREAKRLFGGGHQDSHEFFLLLADSLRSEVSAVEGEVRRGRFTLGLGYTPVGGQVQIPQWPFQGLTANRRSCVECGYTECVRHLGFSCWSLTLQSQSRVRSPFLSLNLFKAN